MAEPRRTGGLAVGAAGVGVTAGALLIPQAGFAKPVTGLALIVSVALVAGVLVVLVIAVLVTIPSDQRTANLERLIRAVRGPDDTAGPPERPPGTPEPGAADGEPPRPGSAGDRRVTGRPDDGEGDTAATDPSPPTSRLARTRRTIRGRIYPGGLDDPWPT